VIGYLLLVVDAERVTTEGSICLGVFEGLPGVLALLVLVAILFLLGGHGSFEGVIVEVPHRWCECLVVHQLVVLVSLIGGR
jgi:hypothetical protein